MIKVLISDKPDTVQNTIVLKKDQAGKWFPALRDNHFSECKVILSGVFQPVKNKYLISIPRLLKQGGLLIIDDTQVSAESRPHLDKILESTGLDKEISQGLLKIYRKKLIQSSSKTQQLHIGFQKLQPKAKIDEDELLKEDVIEKKPKVENCATKVKACANCSCGRKQAENKKTQSQLINAINQGTAKSNCGSCYLGDAFRCASCPYKGLPAFKPGEKIELKLAQDVGQQSDLTKVKVQGGKVKIDI